MGNTWVRRFSSSRARHKWEHSIQVVRVAISAVCLFALTAFYIPCSLAGCRESNKAEKPREVQQRNSGWNEAGTNVDAVASAGDTGNSEPDGARHAYTGSSSVTVVDVYEGTNEEDISPHAEVVKAVGITDVELIYIAERCLNLKVLTILPPLGSNNVQITDVGTSHLAQRSTLVELTIHHAERLTPSGMRFLSSLENLEILDLWHCKRLDGSCLGQVAKPAKLRNVNLSSWSAGVRGADLAYLSGLKQLAVLEMAGSTYQGTSSELAKYLSALNSLKVLNLSACPAVNDMFIADISTKLSLERLTIGSTIVTDECFGSLAQMHSLKFVYLWNCRAISREAITAYSEERPLVEVVWND